MQFPPLEPFGDKYRPVPTKISRIAIWPAFSALVSALLSALSSLVG